ncbi:MAG: hypothetical protein ACYDAD_08705 [Acidimicrobiales bacterium]
MRPGSQVEVQSRFDGSWVRGFEVAEVARTHGDRATALRLRRRSDGTVLPTLFDPEEVRELRRTSPPG